MAVFNRFVSVRNPHFGGVAQGQRHGGELLLGYRRTGIGKGARRQVAWTSQADHHDDTVVRPDTRLSAVIALQVAAERPSRLGIRKHAWAVERQLHGGYIAAKGHGERHAAWAAGSG